MECKVLRAVFREKKGFLGGPHKTEFTIDNPSPMRITVEQGGIRTITIMTETDISVRGLYSVFSRLERLLMIFDGRFIPLFGLEFLDSNTSTDEQLLIYAKHCFGNRLSYYNSVDFCSYNVNKLLDFDSVLTKELYKKWESILEELDVVHQMFLYSLCGSGQPVDIKCAFLIELAEPLVEILKEYKHYFEKLEPGKQGTTLKDCLKALIEKCGISIFSDELSGDRDKFYQVLRNSRVRIMHIKRKKDWGYFDNLESVLYSVKMCLLYRKIIFELLDINSTEYHDDLRKCVSYWNRWNDVLSNFLLKLK